MSVVNFKPDNEVGSGGDSKIDGHHGVNLRVIAYFVDLARNWIPEAT